MCKKAVFILLLGVIAFGYGGLCQEPTTGSSGLIPAALSNLRFQGNATVITFTAGTTAIGFNWTDNSNIDDGTIIERSTDGVTFTEIGRANQASNGYDDSNVAPGITYYYRVRAYNANGVSTPSNIISGTISLSITNTSTSWTKQLGTIHSDDGSGVTTDSNGNIYVVGQIWADETPIYDGANVVGYSNSRDIFIIKYDSTGIEQWRNQSGTTSKEDGASDVAIDTSGNIYVVGTTNGNLDGNTSAGDRDIFMIKYNSIGVKQWTKQFGTASEETASSAAIDVNGNVYVTGWIFIASNSDGSSDYDILLIKYNTDGVKQWERQIGTTSFVDMATGIAADTNGNIYLVGYTDGELDGNTNAGLSDCFIVKYNTDGVKQWTRQFGTASGDGARDVATDASGNIYVAGDASGNLDGNNYGGNSNYDIIVIKYSPDSIKQWTRQLGTNQQDKASDVATDTNGNVYLTGYTEGNLDGNTHIGEEDIFVAKYNADGVKQ